MLKQDAAYTKERVKELEDKNRAQETQLNSQFELIIKLKGTFSFKNALFYKYFAVLS